MKIFLPIIIALFWANTCLCDKYHAKVSAQVVGYDVKERLCSVCKDYDLICDATTKYSNCNTICFEYDNYPCYDSYVVFSYGKKQSTCSIRVGECLISQQTALASVKNNWNKTIQHKIEVDTTTGECHFDVSEINLIEVFGIILFALIVSSLVLIFSPLILMFGVFTALGLFTKIVFLIFLFVFFGIYSLIIPAALILFPVFGLTVLVA